ncbi:MAG: hypothetical protein E6R03_08950 [Hyphomicrobiaceae bacterium]|nr:MAG: hypothetical protein E6R03_08950 [Hyphomicrobiaceae bacterium]
MNSVKELQEKSDLFYLSMIDADPDGLMGEFAKMLGEEAAMKIVDIFGGTSIKIPSKEKIRKAVRRACVWHDAKNGVSLDEICFRYSLSLVSATRIIDEWDKLHQAVNGQKEN